jgi:alpha-L-fucosidase
VDGVTESWSFYDGGLSHEQYMAQLAGFTASRYEPAEWARLFARAGAQYAVLTAKHHDGVALWDTQVSELSVAHAAPARRDLVGPYTDAMREAGLKVGLYFSHLDWSHPDYASVRYLDPTRPWMTDNPYTMPPAGQEDPAAWERFLRFHRAQLRELSERYRPDLLWFDGAWERSAEQWRMREVRDALIEINPEVVFNGRMTGFGDYATPEIGVPITPPDGPWELCYTVNDSWGYKGSDQNYKSVGHLIRTFVETIGGGGNLLLGIGPREDGSFSAEHRSRLEGLGDWIARNREAVYDTVKGMPPGHHYGPSTLSKDGRTLYLHLIDPPREFVCVRGLVSGVKSVSVLGGGGQLAHRRVGGFKHVPADLYIDPPRGESLDGHVTVLALELESEIELYRGGGHG